MHACMHASMHVHHACLTGPLFSQDCYPVLVVLHHRQLRCMSWHHGQVYSISADAMQFKQQSSTGNWQCNSVWLIILLREPWVLIYNSQHGRSCLLCRAAKQKGKGPTWYAWAIPSLMMIMNIPTFMRYIQVFTKTVPHVLSSRKELLGMLRDRYGGSKASFWGSDFIKPSQGETL